MTDVRVPATRQELDDVRVLIRAFNAWHRERHPLDLALIDSYFDAKAFEEELASLPGKYGPPGGALLIAYADGEPAGCVALRRIDDESCEMKRMFVYPKFQGRGIGRALGEAVIEAGRAAGYRIMKLDTSFRQTEAQALYERLGFRRTEPYYDMPQALEDWLVFMELPLE